MVIVMVVELFGRLGGCNACDQLPRSRLVAVPQLSPFSSPAQAGEWLDGADELQRRSAPSELFCFSSTFS
jgi:hypothetical protein